jgi:hypothetical protein
LARALPIELSKRKIREAGARFSAASITMIETATFTIKEMKRREVNELKRLRIVIFNLVLLGLPIWAWAGGGGEKATKLERKVDLANLSGVNHLVASWYNDNIWLYALVVTALMGLVGLAIALVTDVILKMIGMEVSKIEHHE